MPQLLPSLVAGVVAVDALTEFDPVWIGAAMDLSADQYVEAVSSGPLAFYTTRHTLAPLGECLLHPLPGAVAGMERFSPLPPAYRAAQVQARCNGGAQAAASLSSMAHLYRGYAVPATTAVPLLVCASGGPFAQPVVGGALRQVQQLLMQTSSASEYQPFDDSKAAGDLPVQHSAELAQSIGQWLGGLPGQSSGTNAARRRE